MSKLVRSIMGKVKVPNPSPEELARGVGESACKLLGYLEPLNDIDTEALTPVGKADTMSNADDDSPLASIAVYPDGSTPRHDSNTSLSSHAAAVPYRVPPNPQPALDRLPNAGPGPQMSGEFDVLHPTLCYEGPPTSPQGGVSEPDSPLGPVAPLAECGGFQLEERRRSNLLDLERERTRVRLLELERERTRINVLELERERTRINLLNQRLVGMPCSMHSSVRTAFTPPETGDRPRSLDLAWSDYHAGVANAQLDYFPTDLNHRSLSQAWTTGFRSGLGSVA